MEVKVTTNPVYNEAFTDTWLGAFTGAIVGALVDGGVIRLFQDDGFAPTPQDSLATFNAHEATFTDYAGKAAALTVPVNLGADVEGATQTPVWTMTTNPAVTANNIKGWYIQDAAGTGVVAYEVWADAVPMANFGDELAVVVKLPSQLYQIPND